MASQECRYLEWLAHLGFDAIALYASMTPHLARRLTRHLTTVALVAVSARAEVSNHAGAHLALHKPARKTVLPTADLVVVAPHPDDEVLLASGLILGAKQAGQDVAVVVVTNGDLDCRVDGLTRQKESVEALATLGVEEDDIYFLGYPDGHLARMGRVPLRPVPRNIDGKCIPDDHTYGTRGHGRHDFHLSRFGVHALYTSEQAVSDLTLLLEQLRPTRVAVTHPNDTHPDHATTYTFVRRALERLESKAEILRGLVHTGDCWPTGEDASGRCLPGRIAPDETVPPLTGVLTGYTPDVRVPVPKTCLLPDLEENPKLRAISAHRSQTHDDPSSYLFAFARSEEVFFSQKLDDETSERRVLVRTRLPRQGVSKAQTPTGLQSLVSKSGEYVLEVDSETLQAAVFLNAPAGRLLLQRWPLPQDSLAHPNKPLELVLEQVSFGNDVELQLFASNVLIGVSVVAPFARN